MCGDVVPGPGALPIYEDIRQTLESLDKLRAVKGGGRFFFRSKAIKYGAGAGAAAHGNHGEAYLREIDRLLRRAPSNFRAD